MIIFVFLKDYSGKFMKDKLKRNNNGKKPLQDDCNSPNSWSEPEQKHTKEMKLKVLITNRQLEELQNLVRSEERKELTQPRFWLEKLITK